MGGDGVPPSPRGAPERGGPARRLCIGPRMAFLGTCLRGPWPCEQFPSWPSPCFACVGYFSCSRSSSGKDRCGWQALPPAVSPLVTAATLRLCDSPVSSNGLLCVCLPHAHSWAVPGRSGASASLVVLLSAS